jgi:hypothetical protein
MGRAERAFKQAVAEVVEADFQGAGRLAPGTIMPVSSGDLVRAANDGDGFEEESGVITWELPRQPAGARVPGGRQPHAMPRVENVATCVANPSGSSTTTYAAGALEDLGSLMEGGGTCPPGTELAADDDDDPQ